MLISAQATDTVYQAVVQILKQHELEEEPLRQSVLLNDATFVGYRFTGHTVQIDWLAQSNELVGKNHSGDTMFQHKIAEQKSNSDDFASDDNSVTSAA